MTSNWSTTGYISRWVRYSRYNSRNPSLKWPQNPLNQIQTFQMLNAPSEFISALKMKSYSFRVIQSCLNIHKVRQVARFRIIWKSYPIHVLTLIKDMNDCLDWFKMEFNHFYKEFGQFDFVFVVNFTKTKTISGKHSSLRFFICFCVWILNSNWSHQKIPSLIIHAEKCPIVI